MTMLLYILSTRVRRNESEIELQKADINKYVTTIYA